MATLICSDHLKCRWKISQGLRLFATPEVSASAIMATTRYLQTFPYMLGSCPFDHHELKKIIVTWEFREIKCLMSGSDRLLLQRPLGVVMASLKMPSASKVLSKHMISTFRAEDFNFCALQLLYGTQRLSAPRRLNSSVTPISKVSRKSCINIITSPLLVLLRCW